VYFGLNSQCEFKPKMLFLFFEKSCKTAAALGTSSTNPRCLSLRRRSRVFYSFTLWQLFIKSTVLVQTFSFCRKRTCAYFFTSNSWILLVGVQKWIP